MTLEIEDPSSEETREDLAEDELEIQRGYVASYPRKITKQLIKNQEVAEEADRVIKQATEGMRSRLEGEEQHTTDMAELQTRLEALLQKIKSDNIQTVEDHPKGNTIPNRDQSYDIQETGKTDEQTKGKETISTRVRQGKQSVQESHSWSKEKTSTKTAKTTTKTVCTQCQASDCEKVDKNLVLPIRTPPSDKDWHPPQKEKRWASKTPTRKGRRGSPLRNVIESDKWSMDSYNRDTRVMPQITVPETSKGSKFKLVACIKDTILEAMIDSGSYTSLMHERQASRIGLTLVEMKPIKAKAATSQIILRKNAAAKLDLGTCSVPVVFSIISSELWDEEMVLIGSEALANWEAQVNFKDSFMTLKGLYKVNLFIEPKDSKRYIEELKDAYVTLQAETIRAPDEIVVKRNSTCHTPIKLHSRKTLSLDNTYVFFQGNEIKEIHPKDMILGPKFNWETDPLFIHIVNGTKTTVIIPKSCKLGELKVIVSKTVTEKLNSQRNDSHSLKTQNRCNEEYFINVIENKSNSEQPETTSTIDEEHTHKLAADSTMKRIAAEIEKQALAVGEPYVPDLANSETALTQEQVFEELQLPKMLMEKVHASVEEQKVAPGHARLIFR